ncbi:MAG: 50S ribosomal protein L1P [archaeon GW2011_AR13]|nr:MAG: 50S ribosomal protein L1P [archaeon GW2011_AR13]
MKKILLFIRRINWEVTKKMALQEDVTNALKELRKENVRKFDQSVDLIINLQKFDIKRSAVNLFAFVPNQIKEKKIAAFLEGQSDLIDTITKEDFKKYNDKKVLKKLVEKYDFFIAQASVMPKVATTFGRVLGPTGKMPSPQLGIILNPDEKTINELKEKINSSVKIRAKESSIKLAIGKQSMKDEAIVENVMSIFNAVLKELPRNMENVKNVELKFTMTKPIKIKVR